MTKKEILRLLMTRQTKRMMKRMREAPFRWWGPCLHHLVFVVAVAVARLVLAVLLLFLLVVLAVAVVVVPVSFYPLVSAFLLFASPRRVVAFVPFLSLSLPLLFVSSLLVPVSHVLPELAFLLLVSFSMEYKQRHMQKVHENNDAQNATQPIRSNASSTSLPHPTHKKTTKEEANGKD